MEAVTEQNKQEDQAPEAQQEAMVDDQVLKSGLYCLGKTFNNARHAYLSLKVNS